MSIVLSFAIFSWTARSPQDRIFKVDRIANKLDKFERDLLRDPLAFKKKL